jgi:hypothetical protein
VPHFQTICYLSLCHDFALHFGDLKFDASKEIGLKKHKNTKLVNKSGVSIKHFLFY